MAYAKGRYKRQSRETGENGVVLSDSEQQDGWDGRALGGQAD